MFCYTRFILYEGQAYNLDSWRRLILAHRGWSKQFPENTRIACERALELGADGLEFDVQLSSDDVPMVIHDRTVDRTTNGTGPVSSLTAAELGRLNAAHYLSVPKGEGTESTDRVGGTNTLNALERVRFEPIPRLSEILNGIKRFGTHPIVNIELKVHDQSVVRLVNRVLEVVDRSGLQSHQILYSSFRHDALTYLRELRPDVRIGLLFEKEIENPLEYGKQLHAASLNVPYTHLTNEMIKSAQNHGFLVSAWTVDEVRQMKRLFENDINLLITNTPEVALQVRKSV